GPVGRRDADAGAGPPGAALRVVARPGRRRRPGGSPRRRRPRLSLCPWAMTVDYEGRAATYAAGRALDELDLERWRVAIAARCPVEGATVVDVGSGTGIFPRAWRAWGARLT